MPSVIDINVMKFNRWLWIGIVLLVVRALALTIPSVHNLPLFQPSTTDVNSRGTAQQTSVNPCVTVRPAVVTLYAGLEFGSGSIISPDGLVLTNEHVVRDTDGGQIRARGWSGTLFIGQVLATDPINDLALVQLNTKESLPVIRLAKPDGIEAGQAVCAIGSPFARTGIITLGRLKGARENGDLEATILLHPGNSGGPLVNTQGEMIGVNKAVWLSETGENIGIGFATKTVVAQQFIEQNRQKAELAKGLPIAPDLTTPQPSVAIGSDLPPESPANAVAPTAPLDNRLGAIVNERSLVVQIVEPNSPAENAGMTAGDRLVAVDGQRLNQLGDLQTILNRRPKSAVFTISREEQQQELRVSF
ncbi:MAG: S1C family serine protease [Stenomitos frigidus ULC029]